MHENDVGSAEKRMIILRTNPRCKQENSELFVLQPPSNSMQVRLSTAVVNFVADVVSVARVDSEFACKKDDPARV